MSHVAHRIQMHERGNRIDHNQHNRREAIKTDGPACIKCARLDPCHQFDLARDAIKSKENNPAQRRREEQKPSGNPLRGFITKGLVAKTNNQCAKKWSEENNLFHALIPSSR